MEGGVGVPGAVGVDADVSGGTECVTDCFEAFLVVGEGLTRFCDFHFCGGAAV